VIGKHDFSKLFDGVMLISPTVVTRNDAWSQAVRHGRILENVAATKGKNPSCCGGERAIAHCEK